MCGRLISVFLVLVGCSGRSNPVIDAPPAVDGAPDAVADAPPDAPPDAPVPAAYWVHNEHTRFDTVATDAAGNVYVTGSTGTSPVYLVIASYTPMGEQRWRHEIVSVGGNGVSHLVVSGSTIYMTGDFLAPITFGTTTLTTNGAFRDIFVVELSTTDGAVITARAFGTPDTDEALGIGVDAAGNIAIAGNAGAGTMSFGDASLSGTGTRPIGGFVVSFDAAGHHRWSYGYDRSSDTGAHASVTGLAMTAGGAVGVVGALLHAADFGSGIVAAPSSTFPSGYLVLYGGDGAVRAVRIAHAGIDDSCGSVARDPAGRLAIACIRSEPDPDNPGGYMDRGRLEWYSPAGDLLDGKLLVAHTAQYPRIAFDAHGDVVGAFVIDSATLDGQPLPDGGPWLVLTLDPAASSLVEAHRVGAGSTFMQINGFAISPSNALLASGSLGTDLGSVDFGRGPETVVTGGFLVQVPR